MNLSKYQISAFTSYIQRHVTLFSLYTIKPVLYASTVIWPTMLCHRSSDKFAIVVDNH